TPWLSKSVPTLGVKAYLCSRRNCIPKEHVNTMLHAFYDRYSWDRSSPSPLYTLSPAQMFLEWTNQRVASTAVPKEWWHPGSIKFVEDATWWWTYFNRANMTKGER